MNRQRIKILFNMATLLVICLIIGGSVLAFHEPTEKTIPRTIKPGKTNWVGDEIIVKFRPKATRSETEQLSQESGLLEMDVNGHILKSKFGAGVFKSKNKNLDQLIQELQNSPLVEYAEPNYSAQALLVPNDTYYNYQWNFKNLDMEKVWDISTGQGVVVAVVDTGVAYRDYGWNYRQAPDLAQTSFAEGWDFVNNDAYALDDNGHGTHIAGTIAGSTNNSEGVAGIAYNSTIMPVKVLDASGVGTYADIAEGIVWAADHGAQVINLSLGGLDYSKLLEDAVQYAYNRGVVIVAAAGNSSLAQVFYPAAYDDYVLAVGAVNAKNTRAVYSNWGKSLNFMAPGGDLNRDDNGDGYGDGILQQTLARNWWGRADTRNFGYYFYQGTSQATAHLSGVAALLIANGLSSPFSVEDTLKQTAVDLGAPGHDQEYGWGFISPLSALQLNNPQVLDLDLEDDDLPDPQVEVEEPEQEAEEVAEVLDVAAEITNRQGNIQDEFMRRERVYVESRVTFAGAPIDDADLLIEVTYPHSSANEVFTDDTNRNGESREYIGKYRQTGIYGVAIRVSKDGYEDVVWLGQFEVK